MKKATDFQQLVDRELSGLQWNERRKRSVLRAVNKERNTPAMKKKMTSLLAVALTLCLLAGAALAATLVYSSRYTQAEKADALLAQQYGITADKLSMFTRSFDGMVYRYESLPDFSGMPGDYVVDLTSGNVQWLFDGPEGSGWDAAKLAEVLTLCQAEDGYAQVVREAKAAAADLSLAVPPAAPVEQAMQEAESHAAANTERESMAQSMAKISMEEAKALAIAALRQKYALTDAQVEQLAFVEESSLYTTNGETPNVEPYFWLMQQEGTFTEKDGIYIVVVNALDGTIEGIHYDTALLGNG